MRWHSRGICRRRLLKATDKSSATERAFAAGTGQCQPFDIPVDISTKIHTRAAALCAMARPAAHLVFRCR
jgi:hypothetical protein